MFIRYLLISFSISAAIMVPKTVLGADLAFAENFLSGSKQVVTYPVGDPTQMTPVGAPQTDTFGGMDFTPDGLVLWAIDFTAQTVGTVDQSTGVYTPTASIQDGCCVKALTINPVSGKFYVSRDDRYVYELNPATGVTILIAAGAAPGAQITAMATDCNGRLFTFDANAAGGILYEAHLDGGPTLVGASGYLGPTSIDFDNETGVLYGWFNASPNTYSTHATVSTTTGLLSQTSLVEGKYRMAIRNRCSIFANGFEI